MAVEALDIEPWRREDDPDYRPAETDDTSRDDDDPALDSGLTDDEEDD